jgi:signal transduction histidine kinase
MGSVTVSRRTVAGVLVEDLLIAGALSVWAVVDGLTSGDWPQPHTVSAALAGTAAAALALRRSRPLAAAGAAVAALAAVHVFLGGYQAGSALVIAIVGAYSLGAYGRDLWPAVVLCATLAASWSLDGRFPQAAADAVFVVLVTVFPFWIGRAAHRQRSATTALTAQTVELHRQQDALVRRAEEERRRMARELHDVISHGLGVVVLHAGVAEEWMQRDPQRARKALEQIRETGTEAIAEMARLVRLMRDDSGAAREPQPTLHDLDRLAARWSGGRVRVTLVTEGVRRKVPAAVELSAYRVAQEALTNISKHSDATEATITVRFTRDDLQVEVSDNGSRVRTGAGLRSGLAGLRERVAVFGGRFEAGRQSSGGWAVRASFPVPS